MRIARVCVTVPRRNDAALREKLRDLANQRRGFVYRCLHIQLRREGVMINRKLTFYQEEGWRLGVVVAASGLLEPRRRLRSCLCRTSG